MSKALQALALFMLSTGYALAGTVDTSDPFYTFLQSVQDYTGGPLGIGIATLMTLVGGVIGVARNSPMPALSGVGGAAILHWGPNVIEGMMLNGGLI